MIIVKQAMKHIIVIISSLIISVVMSPILLIIVGCIILVLLVRVRLLLLLLFVLSSRVIWITLALVKIWCCSLSLDSGFRLGIRWLAVLIIIRWLATILIRRLVIIILIVIWEIITILVIFMLLFIVIAIFRVVWVCNVIYLLLIHSWILILVLVWCTNSRLNLSLWWIVSTRYFLTLKHLYIRVVVISWPDTVVTSIILVLIILDRWWHASRCSFLFMDIWWLTLDILKLFSLGVVAYLWFLINILINAMYNILSIATSSTCIFLISIGSFAWLINDWLL